MTYEDKFQINGELALILIVTF